MASLATYPLLHEDLSTSETCNYFLRGYLADSRKILPEGTILQVQNIWNLSVPKEERELGRVYNPSKHVLKVGLTDGDAVIYALVLESLPHFSLNTPPGTKVKITKVVSISHALFVLSKINHQVLGGNVTKLIEKWTLQKKLNIKQEWGYQALNMDGGDGPPMWKAFGYKASLDLVKLRNMKAMDIVNEQKDVAKQSDGKKTQFEVQRGQALEELRNKSLKQNWCPPVKNLLDKELADLLQEGFSLEEAEEALKRYKNPRKALQHLKGTMGANKVSDFREEQRIQPEKEKPKRRNLRTDEDDEDAEVPREYQRPAKSISLFGFIEQHIKPENAPQKPGKVDSSLEEMDDLRLALGMSLEQGRNDELKRKSKYVSYNDFPSLEGEPMMSNSRESEQQQCLVNSSNGYESINSYGSNSYPRNPTIREQKYSRDQHPQQTYRPQDGKYRPQGNRFESRGEQKGFASEDHRRAYDRERADNKSRKEYQPNQQSQNPQGYPRGNTRGSNLEPFKSQSQGYQYQQRPQGSVYSSSVPSYNFSSQQQPRHMAPSQQHNYSHSGSPRYQYQQQGQMHQYGQQQSDNYRSDSKFEGEGWKPSQTLVFTRSKNDNSDRGNNSDRSNNYDRSRGGRENSVGTSRGVGTGNGDRYQSSGYSHY